MALAAAALLAIGLVAAITLAGGQSTGADDAPVADGPAVRIGGRAGLVTVGVAACARSLELTLIGPDIDGDEAELREIRLTTPADVSSILHARSCGPGCYLAPAVLERDEKEGRCRPRADTATHARRSRGGVRQVDSCTYAKNLTCSRTGEAGSSRSSTIFFARAA